MAGGRAELRECGVMLQRGAAGTAAEEVLVAFQALGNTSLPLPPNKWPLPPKFEVGFCRLLLWEFRPTSKGSGIEQE